MTVKAILLDYIGTLVEPRNYTLQDSKLRLHRALCQAGLATNKDEFMKAYAEAHEKYRLVRFEQLREVTNAVWVSEALNAVNCKVTVDDARLKAGLNVFFQDFIDSLELRPNARKLIKTLHEHCKVGLVSNFTYAPVIYASLRKFGIGTFFDAVIVSEAIGWRKPHRKIFDEALRTLQVKHEEAIFIGDSPLEDIDGAKAAGLRTILVASCFNPDNGAEKCHTKPDLVFTDLNKLCEACQRMLAF